MYEHLKNVYGESVTADYLLACTRVGFYKTIDWA